MNCIAKEIKSFNDAIMKNAERKFSVKIREDIYEFLKKNSGGYPIKDIIVIDGEDYEIRSFLSADEDDEYYCIERPMDYFLKKTNGKIIPIGIDSGDNYYCVNNETGKVYYWRTNEDKYFCVALNLTDFELLFKD